MRNNIKEIKYVYTGIYCLLALICCLLLCFVLRQEVRADAASKNSGAEVSASEIAGAEVSASEIAGAEKVLNWTDMNSIGELALYYANQFSVDRYEGGYCLISIENEDHRFLTIPEGMTCPENPEDDIVPLYLPVTNIYLAASSAMDLFRQLDALDTVSMTGTEADDWTIPEIRELVENGTIQYGGKYSTPDYELILSNGCNLAIESTMICHTPEVKEQLESLGIPVMTERSSYESNPLGRVEWIRLYGILTGKEEEASAFMDEIRTRYQTITAKLKEGTESPSVAFFYISSNGYANVRKPGDYISEMIQMAGGSYVFSDLVPEEENALSTMNLQMESFYEHAVDADILIYNSTVETELSGLDQLLDKSRLLADFKAVQSGNVWCTRQNMYQETTGTIGMIEDFYAIISGEADGKDELNYMYRLK